MYDWSHVALSLVTRRESVKGLLSCLHVAHHKHSHIGTVKSHINFEGILCIGYTMRMRGYRIYTTEGEARGRVFDDPESELYNRLVPECGGVSVSYWFIPSCPM